MKPIKYKMYNELHIANTCESNMLTISEDILLFETKFNPVSLFDKYKEYFKCPDLLCEIDNLFIVVCDQTAK
jgi:hypothetical protein